MIHPAHITQKVHLNIFKVFVLIPSYSPGDWGGTRKRTICCLLNFQIVLKLG